MKSNITEILEGYEKTRAENESILRKRIEEVYSKIPRLKEIDNKINSTGFEIASSIFKASNDDFNIDEFINSKKKSIEVLKQEKAILLTENGYPIEYLDKIYTCSKCKDTGYIETKKCNCLKQKIINLYYKQSNLNTLLKRENFSSFRDDLYSSVISETYKTSPKDNIMEIKAKCVDFCETFNSSYNNILFTGSTGLGKTFLCNCIAMEVLKKGKSVLYNTSSALIDNIRNIKYNNHDSSNLDYILNCDLLIIDDLGTENTTQSAQSELFNILNERLLLRKKMIVSTNLSLEELQMKYHPRIVSRIVGNFELCEFFGQDIRIILNSHKVKRG